MQVDAFLQNVEDHLGVDFYTGVPDSQLKELCDTLYRKYGISNKHIIASNEGGAVGLAAGHYLATRSPALVYMQNSGIGNAVNPIVSLLNHNIYGIPVVFIIGWRGEPGQKDEPQHIFQGEITLKLLELLQISSFILSKNTSQQELLDKIQSCKGILERGNSVAFVVSKGTFDTIESPNYRNAYHLKREDALSLLLQSRGTKDIFISTTGKTSREVFELRESLHQGHERDFLTVGSMGHASMIALGMAMSMPHKRIWCLDGDGAAVMHLGSMAVETRMDERQLVHVVFNNGSHESVGGLPVACGMTRFSQIAHALGYKHIYTAENRKTLQEAIQHITETDASAFLEIYTAIGSRDNLGRPSIPPSENKEQLMDMIEKEMGRTL